MQTRPLWHCGDLSSIAPTILCASLVHQAASTAQLPEEAEEIVRQNRGEPRASSPNDTVHPNPGGACREKIAVSAPLES